ncbi:MAG: xylulokinase [Bacillota bacterium]|nr:xylulokinase [Bacillota bacterium]
MTKPAGLLSVDIGTESGRVAFLDLEGRVLASSSRPYALRCPRPGWAEQDPELWWESTVENIRDVLATLSGAQVLAVGVGGQMHATVPVDRSGRLVSRDALLWCDKRSADQCAAVAAQADEGEMLRLTGNAPVPAWTGFKLRWLKENQQEVYDRAEAFLTCKDYLNLRLTGERYTDYSEASGTYLFDARTRRWSPELCDLLGVDPSKLPPIVESSSVIGSVTAEAAKVTGLPKGTPVVCGGGDMMCLLLGAGITLPGQACDVTGTAADVSVYVPQPLYDRRLMHLHHVIPGGGWISFGILDAGGGSYKWFRDTFAAAEVAEARAAGISAYELLNRKAQDVPAGAEGLFYLPYLLGERTLGTSDSRGVFFGLTPRHTLGHCVRAIMEGVAYDLRQSLDLIEAEGIRIEEVRAVGGGARSPLWSSIKADVYRKTIVTLKNFEGGVVGAAILAGLGVGVYKDASEAVQRVVSLEARYEPDAERAAHYERAYRVFKSLHDGLQPLFKEMAALER